MWWKQLLLGAAGFGSGLIVAAGLFALIIALGIVSDFADRTHTAKYVLLYEETVALGGILGNIVSIYQVILPLGQWGAGLYGIFAGIFVGAWAMALTEILNIIPIFSRRMELRRGLSLVVFSMVIGRTVGALLFYYQGW